MAVAERVSARARQVDAARVAGAAGRALATVVGTVVAAVLWALGAVPGVLVRGVVWAAVAVATGYGDARGRRGDDGGGGRGT